MFLLKENERIVEQEAEDEERARKRRRSWGGSHPGRAPNVKRDIRSGHEQLWQDYLAPDAVFPANVFRRRFRMRKSLFLKIMKDIRAHDPEMRTRYDALGQPGLSTMQKCTAAIRMLAYSQCADSLDDTIRAGESTIMGYMKRFCKDIVGLYEDEFLRTPTREDIIRMLAENKARGFPGCIMSLECMHWSVTLQCLSCAFS
jgi:hypothetical protein